MTTLFIADLHLEENRAAITEVFLHFLQKTAVHAEALYILGDLFESWIGDDDPTPFHKKIKTALLTLTESGVPVYIIPGNRDFLMGQRFSQETGCRLLPDPTVINLYGQP